MQDSNNPQNALFRILDQIPGQLWYILGIGSIIASAVLQISGRKNAADFVGKWPPTFLAVGLYHKLVRPSSEDASGQMQRAGEQLKNTVSS